MKNALLKAYVKGQVLVAALKNDENGQDLVEYALAVALVALLAIAGMTNLSTAISNGFNNVAGALNKDLT